MALMQLQSVEMCDITKDREYSTESTQPLTSFNARENWPCPSLTEALRRGLPTLHLDSTGEMTLFVEA